MRNKTVRKVKRMGSGALDSIKDNAVIYSAAGLGLGLLAWNSLRGKKLHYRPGKGVIGRETYMEEPVTEEPFPPGIKEYHPSLTLKERGRRAGRKFWEYKGRAGEVAESLKERAGRIGGELKSGAGSAGSTLKRSASKNPVALALAGLGIGMAIGLLVPESRRERRFFGGREKPHEAEVELTATEEGITEEEAEAERASKEFY